MVGKNPVKKKDQEKRKACKEAGVTLVEVPYWWDNTIESLANFIHKVCYDTS